MKHEKEIHFLTQLIHAHGLGRARVLQLIDRYGSAEEALKAGLDQSQKTLFGKWEISSAWERDLEEAEKAGVRLISYQNKIYPSQLLKIPDFPLLLYVKGALPEESPCLALIGTRNATLYGKQTAHKLAKEVAEWGVWVVERPGKGNRYSGSFRSFGGKWQNDCSHRLRP